MLFPQAMLVIFKFLDYLDSRVIEKLRFPFSLGSLTMKGQSARKPLQFTPPPPTPKRQGDHLSHPSSLSLSVNTAWIAPLTQVSADFFPMFFKLSPLLTS